MKRALLLIMVLVMVLTSVPCYATEVATTEGTAQSTVYCTIESSFCVVIPKNIDCYSSFTFKASSMNILDSQQVSIYLTGDTTRIPVFNESGDSVDVQFLVDGNPSVQVALFTRDMLESSRTVICEPAFSTTPKAGNNTGTAEFIVRLEEKVN